MGCTHADACPLFPLLNASLQSWRDYYCDSEDRWLTCARYELAVRGELVPISLLPNGHDAGHLRRASDRLTTAPTIPRFEPVTPAQPDQNSPKAGGWFEPQPTVARPQPPRSSQGPPPPPRPPAPEPQAPQRRAPRRFWWTRLADWMKGSA